MSVGWFATVMLGLYPMALMLGIRAVIPDMPAERPGPHPAHVGYMVYAVDPSDFAQYHVWHAVPDIVLAGVPYFTLGIVLEALALCWKERGRAGRRWLPRANDSLSSIGSGIVMGLCKVTVQPVSLALYAWLYERLHVVVLPDPFSWWGWLLSFLAYDLGYYLYHRASHEINFLWSHHVVHHSSEEYNLTTALRQSAFQQYFSGFFQLPFVFVIPPVSIAVHSHLNTLYARVALSVCPPWLLTAGPLHRRPQVPVLDPHGGR